MVLIEKMGYALRLHPIVSRSLLHLHLGAADRWLQVNQVKSEADRLGREKVDTSALEFYTSRVSTLFEQVRACTMQPL